MSNAPLKDVDLKENPENTRVMRLAMVHFESGRPADAEKLCRQILRNCPDHAESMHLLGILAAQSGDLDTGIVLIGKCVEARPDWSEAHCNLANTLRGVGRLDDSIAAARRAVELSPVNAMAHYNIGAALYEKGAVNEAVAEFKIALNLDPRYPQAMNDLGICLAVREEYEAAISLYREAVRLNPRFSEAHNNLGNALKVMGRLDEAIASYRLALSANPRFVEAINNLGVALLDSGRFDESLQAFIAALKIDSDYVEALNNLGNLLVERGQIDDAIRVLRRAIKLNPDLAQVHNNLANALKSSGQLGDAVEEYQKSVELAPDESAFLSNLAYASLFHPDYGQSEIGALLARWSDRHAKGLMPPVQAFQNAPLPDRRLRIGYISPDFRNHVIGRNILPLLREHDQRQFEIFCYARLDRRDEATSQFQKSCNVWRDITGLSDDRVAQMISEDGIDILIDLAMHLSDNVLSIVARKPAPVQMTFAAYPGSTGLQAIDYRMSDPYLDALGKVDSSYSENTLCLRETFWCYDPREITGSDAELPGVAPLPALASGGVTFGCLCEFCKVNPKTLDLWARVMKRVPGSMLVMLTPPGESRQRVVESFRIFGVSPERLMFLGRQPRLEYLRVFDVIDISLDTLPYNGHTTSLDSMWMGVPVVTKIGSTVVGRAGWSQLSNLGLTQLAARTDEEFVDIAVNLAADLPKLAELRADLRPRMEASPLMDAGRFARNIELAYRAVWRDWCSRQELSLSQERVEVEVIVPVARRQIVTTP